MRLFILISTLFVATLGKAQYNYSFTSPNYANDTLVIGQYYGEKQVAKDTAYRVPKTKTFVWKGNKALEQGLYMGLVKPSNNVFQFVVLNENKFELKFDTVNLGKVEVVSGSPENKLFYEYIAFVNKKRSEIDPYKAAAEDNKKKGISSEVENKMIDDIDKEVKAKQAEIIAANPKSFTAFLIKSLEDDVIFPEAIEKDTSKPTGYVKYMYYKAHFFDNIDFNSPLIPYNNFIAPRIETFFSKVVSTDPDSITKEMDVLLNKMKNNKEAVKLYLPQWINKFGANKIIGQDAIFVHLMDNYVNKGWAPWVTPDKMEALNKYANEYRPVLINKIFPNITTYQKNWVKGVATDSVAISLHKVQANYTLALFWAHDCGHCAKSMPYIVKWEEKYRSYGVKVFSVCTNAYDKEKACWPAMIDKKMENFINTTDIYGTFRRQVAIPATPKLYFLDKNKKIIFKDFDAERIDAIFEDILRVDKAKSSKS